MSHPYTHSFVPEAGEEYLLALTWYADNVSKAIAKRFRLDVQAGLDAICQSPQSWQKEEMDERFRRFVLKSFPFKIIYAVQVDKGNILVIAVASTRRKPGYWEERVE